MNIIFLGPQGSGKGTQSKAVAKKLEAYYLNTGAILRKLAKTDPQIDKVINEVGALIPDGVMFNIITGLLNKEATNSYKDIIFDGYPRSVKQYELLSSFLNDNGVKIDKVVILEIDPEESIKRLAGRRIHRETGEIYNLVTDPPPPDINPQDLYQRPDDNPEAIKKRLEEYTKTTEPLIALLTKEKLTININAAKPIDEVTRDIEAALNI
jgi:adenylate kinase